ncbi:MAG TPA: GntR family transcriptional regulator [Methylomirabilota bacterium]|jgi:DNA-binding GntR family transcriptional regulator|nr:GntR family transcriptional regulator [Methylomirabilota bacterium]
MRRVSTAASPATRPLPRAPQARDADLALRARVPERLEPARGVSPRSRADDAYRHLKTEIVSARTVPGTPLNEQEIAGRLRISRTPVREAIRRLEQEGLVVRHPNRGALVAPLSMRDVLEIWQLREILEPAACRLAAGRVDGSALAALEAALTALAGREPRLEDYERHHRTDLALHRLVAAATGNRFLLETLDRLTGRIARIRMVNSPVRFRRSLREHLTIAAALRRGDGDAAAEAMRTHLANARAGLYTLS